MNGSPETAREARVVPLPGPTLATAEAALVRGADHLISLQSQRGDWEGEMVWNTMILSQHVIVRTIVGKTFSAAERLGIRKHYQVTQREDGSWGMHPESQGYVFFTTLAYVALRLLGVSPDEEIARRARHWLHVRGVTSIPTWGKYWLCFLGLWEYEGVNPCPPEIYALPSWLPIHPSKYYCHTRNIYMGLAYLYGRRFRADLGPLAAPLRDELFGVPYRTIDFRAHRGEISPADLHVAPSLGVRGSATVMMAHERVHSRAGRARALRHVFDRIVYEQRSSNYQGLSPVNGLLNCLSIYACDPGHPDLAPSIAGVEKWKWEDESEGIRYCGARSNSWDTAFAMQALLEHAPIRSRARHALGRGYRFLDGAQLTAELPGYRAEHRDPARGGWCFSDGVHRWPVSDCTAEALAALTAVHQSPDLARELPHGERVDGRRLGWAAEFILQRQNDDGGFGTYEKRRGSAFLEGINNTEMYGNCMTERSYLECTASSIAALSHLAAHPCEGISDELVGRVRHASLRGIAFLRAQQRPDGSFPGFWGINFTYAIFHVVKGFRAADVARDDPALVRAAEWLIGHQRDDGGWGEHHASCLDDRYVEHEESQPVMTAWAVLALLEIVGPRARAVQRGIDWLVSRQRPDGSWPDGAVNGVFFGSAMLDYRYYKFYFPTWALARQAALLAS